MIKLAGKRVLVVGGSSGIGQAVAAAALAEGAQVTIAGRSAERLEKAAGILGNVRAVQVDTADADRVASIFQAEVEFDHVLISAAQTPTGPVRKLAPEDARAAMDSKFWGAYTVARLARIAERGSLTFVSGFLAERPSSRSVLQGAINAALEALARGLALELAPVRVNTISPGLIDTPLWSRMEDDARLEMFARVGSHLPVGRVGLPDDIANAAIYLMTTGFATGSVVRVDGGGVIA
nr:SDR family oxidoreductase [Geminicoccus roseus]